MEFKYVDFNSDLYEKAITLRVDAFFKGMPNVVELINDQHENSKSWFLVALKENQVVAAGRLCINDEIGGISQMVVHNNYQKQGLGSAILKILLEKCRRLSVKKVSLSARESAIDFYKKHGFYEIGKKYPSVKTGVIHVKMEVNM